MDFQTVVSDKYIFGQLVLYIAVFSKRMADMGQKSLFWLNFLDDFQCFSEIKMRYMFFLS